jgi:hypothetical protein
MTFFRPKKKFLALALLIGVMLTVGGGAVPMPVHAAGEGILGQLVHFDFFDTLLDGIISLLTLLNELLAKLLNNVTIALKWILTLKIVGGITVVGKAWELLRDFCNMFFIVIMVLIAFGTIFNATGWLKQFYFSTALIPLIIGAIVINFSLAIGKTATLASNQVAQIFINIMPDMGNTLIRILKPQQFVLAPERAPIDTTDIANKDLMKNATKAEQDRYAACLNEEKEVRGTVDDGFFKYLDQSIFGGQKIRKNIGDCRIEIAAARRGTTEAATVAQLSAGIAGKTTGAQKSALIMTALGATVMLIMLTSCLATAFIFLGFRIIVIWILLAGSAVAWFSYAVPGKKLFNDWLEHFIAWNVFGPLYLFCLVPGTIMLQGSGEITTALSRAGAGTTESIIQVFFYYAFAVAVFIGGLGLAFKTSYAGAVKSTAFFGKQLQKFGVFDPAGMAPARYVSEKTGITNYAQAAKDRFNQQKGDITAALRGRLPTLLGTKEEGLASARRALGVLGADVEYEKEIAKRIKAQKDIIEAQVNKLDKEKQEAYLKAQFKSANRDARLAAGEIMLSRGKLDTTGRQTMLTNYEKISPTAKKEFQKRVTEQALKEASKTVYKDFDELKAAAEVSGDKRKFLEAAIKGEAGRRLKLEGKELNELTDLMKGNPEDQRAFLEAASKNTRTKVAAIESMANMDLLFDRKGNKLTADQAFAQEANSFDADNWLQVEALRQSQGGFSPELQQKFDEYASRPKNLQEIIRGTGDPAQIKRVTEHAVELAAGAALGVQVGRVQTEAINMQRENERKRKEAERNMSTIQSDANKANEQLSKLSREADKARQSARAEEGIYNTNPTKQNLDKWKRAENDLQSAEADVADFKNKLNS